jgi:predicted dehydrogenase
MSTPLRFGIIGCGVIAPTHADALLSLQDAHLRAVADVVPERAHKLAERYDVRTYTDPAEMLARETLDVVNICTPSGLHGHYAALAMRAGCHVMIEKPIEITTAAIDTLLAVQRESGVKLAVISNHRFDAASQQVFALTQDGAFGRLVLGCAHIPWWRSQEYYDSGAWRGTWSLDGGGILMNQSIHSIDLLQWFMGPVHSLRAYTDTLVHRIDSEDVAVAVLRFASGALGTISATTGAYPGAGTQIGIYGDRGSAVIENDQIGFLHLARDEQGAVGPYGRVPGQSTRNETDDAAAPDRATLPASTHALQISDMIRAIRDDGTPLVDGWAARRAVDIILGIYASSRSGEEVVLS